MPIYLQILRFVKWGIVVKTGYFIILYLISGAEAVHKLEDMVQHARMIR